MTAMLEQPISFAKPPIEQQSLTGYLHSKYAQSLGEFGKPRLLPRSGGWILQRPIADTDRCDAMGCYPLLCCRNWQQIGADLDDLNGQLVSFAAVIDPFAPVSEAELHESFDVVKRYKEHWCVDLHALDGAFGNKHHRYYARKALQEVTVEIHTQPLDFVAEWSGMYANLVRRHDIRGIQIFSPQSFEAQLNVPGLFMFRATRDGIALAAQLWYVQGAVAYNHLAASTDAGYSTNASYALYYSAISAFRDGLAPDVQFVQLGAGAGVAAKDDGLTQFKKGWANCSRPAWFCGRILDRQAYESLSTAVGDSEEDYFPAYRRGEMT